MAMDNIKDYENKSNFPLKDSPIELSTCPHCGYCSHCGRHNVGPWYPYNRPDLKPYPYYWPYTYTISYGAEQTQAYNGLDKPTV